MPDGRHDVCDKIFAGGGSLDDILGQMKRLNPGLPSHVNSSPENVERGLAKLVLTLIELLRQLMERQAIRRMEGGSLSDDEIERLGQTFILLKRRMEELKEAFDLEGEDLNLNLGPLGKLM